MRLAVERNKTNLDALIAASRALTGRAFGLAVLAAFMVVDSALAYYNPATGRWLSRDPIGEEGGINLMAAFGNSPLLYFDAHGKEDQTATSSKVCCLYRDDFKYSGRELTVQETTHCYKQIGCNSSTLPEDCCRCCGPKSHKSFHLSRVVSLMGARRGACCFCTISVLRNPFGIGWKNWLPHHELVLTCPASDSGSAFTVSIDRIPEGTIYGPAHVNYSRYPSQRPVTAASKRIPCDVGYALKWRIDRAYPRGSSGQGTDPAEDCLFGNNCRDFAFRWYEEAGAGYRSCAR